MTPERDSYQDTHTHVEPTVRHRKLARETVARRPGSWLRGWGEAESGASRRKPGCAGRRNHQGLPSNMLRRAETETNEKRKRNKKSAVLIKDFRPQSQEPLQTPGKI